MFVLFSRKFWSFLEFGSFSKMGDKPYTKAVKQDIFSQFFKSTTKVTIFFQKSLAILTQNRGQT